MKRRLIVVICVCLSVIIAASIAGAKAKIKTVKIQPAELSQDGWINADNWKKTPTIPKGKWVKFTLPVTKNGKEYYFKFVPTKKKGYKYFLTTKRTKNKNDSEIRSCSISIYQYDEVTVTDADTRWKLTEKMKLAPGARSWICIVKSMKMWDPVKANIQLLLREVPMNPEKVKINEVTGNTNSITVKYDKSKYASKYKVAYKRSGGKWKYAITKKLRKTVTGLKSNKKYTVKVRAIRIVKSKKYYGRWSAPETVDLAKSTEDASQ